MSTSPGEPPSDPGCQGPVTPPDNPAQTILMSSGSLPGADRTSRLPGESPSSCEISVPTPHGPAVPLPDRIGRFEIRAFLGEGAFGRVYQAYDPSLKRMVALKVARPERLTGDDRIRRFLREAQAAANLLHPHIVAVFDSGQDGPFYYLACAHISGRSLDRALLELPKGQTLPVRQAVSLVQKLAEALAYAHREGVIHRDVKPGNVMLREDGEPLLMDFGLASRVGETRLTELGVVLGTPQYVAPEQWQGHAQPASDQYSLGCMLFEMLTGKAVFEGTDARHYLFLHLQTAASSPRNHRPDLPRDLEAICLKCLEKEPTRRYPTCQALADDLKRWLEGQPVTARLPGPGERLMKWARRNPLAATLAAAVLFTLLTGVSVATFFAIQADRAARAAQDSAKAADENAQQLQKAKERAELLVYAGKLSLAQREWQDNNGPRALALLQECQKDLRGWEHRHLWTLYNSNQRMLRGHTSAVTAVAWSPDGKRIVSASHDNTLKVWDAGSGKDLFTLPGHGNRVTSVAWSPDGKRIASGGWDNTVKLWDAASGKELRTLEGHTSTVSSVAWSGDNRYVASGGWDNTVRVWDTEKESAPRILKGHTSAVSSVSWSGGNIASGSWDNTVKLWDAEKGQELRALEGHTRTVFAVAWSPDGSRIASASDDRTVKVWEAKSGMLLQTLEGHTDRVTSVAWNRDGNALVSGSFEKTLKVWDVRKGQEVRTLKGHTGEINSVAWSPDGQQIASGSADSTVKLWDARKGQEVLTLTGHTSTASSAAWSPDGKQVVSGSDDTTLKIWDVEKGRETHVLRGHRRAVNSVAWSPDGKWIISGSSDDTVRLWDAAKGEAVHTFEGHKDSVTSVVWSPDASRFISGSEDRTVAIWDVKERIRVASLTLDTPVTCLAWSRDGGEIASGSREGIIQLWKAIHDGTVKVWDAKKTRTLKGHASAVAYLPTLFVLMQRDIVLRPIASASQDGTVKVWDAKNGEVINTLSGHAGQVNAVAWSPQGRRIVSGGSDRTLKVWDWATGQELLTLKGNTDRVTSVAWSGDGTRIVSTCADGTLRIWDGSKAP